jgi:type II secretory pathway component PulC
VKFSLKVATRFGVRFCTAGLLILPVAYAVFVLWQERQYRDHLAQPIPTVTAAIPEPARVLMDATAVATVFGLTPQTTLLASAEPLTLQASFVVSNGLSRALLADAQGSRIYQVGERLPGGSVLRRVDAQHVVLWNKGREEQLALQPSAVRFLRPLDSTAESPAATMSTRFLRPLSGPSE